MADKVRGSRGKRGKKDRQSRSLLSSRVMKVYDPELKCYVEVRETHDITTSVLAANAAVYWDCAAELEETVEDHIIPRRSLSRAQMLKFQRPEITETIQLGINATKGEHAGKKIAEDTKVIKMTGGQTLLNRGIPFRQIVDPITGEIAEQSILKRQTSVTKRVKGEDDTVYNRQPKKKRIATPSSYLGMK